MIATCKNILPLARRLSSAYVGGSSARFHSRLTCLLMLAALVLGAGARASAAPPDEALPEVRVDFLGAEKGYAVGTNSVALLCVLRNVGTTALPANTLRVRCYTLAGLDYTDGELTPLVPALGPGQAASFRWRVVPTDKAAPLVTSVLITRIGAGAGPPKRLSPVVVSPGAESAKPAPASVELLTFVPRAVLAVVPHIASPAAANAPLVGFLLPNAVGSASAARIGNDRVVLKLLAGANKAPLGLLGVKVGTAWQSAGVLAPAFTILASADGQSPWQRAFKWNQTDARTEAGAAYLTLSGKCGDDWDAQIFLVCRKDTAAIDGIVRIKALRTSRLFGMQLPRMTAAADSTRALPPADGSSSIVEPEPAPFESDGIAAVHRGAITSGVAWTLKPPLQDWITEKLPMGDTDHLLQLGASWNGGERGEVVLPGGIIDFPFRIFGMSPSDSVKDAERFAIIGQAGGAQ